MDRLFSFENMKNALFIRKLFHFVTFVELLRSQGDCKWDERKMKQQEENEYENDISGDYIVSMYLHFE